MFGKLRSILGLSVLGAVLFAGRALLRGDAPPSSTEGGARWLEVSGTFRIEGSAPDGDSVRFYPDSPEVWRVQGAATAPRFSRSGGLQVRLEGIDALETHYTSKGISWAHQPLDLADAAADELLHFLGFTKVEREPGGRVRRSEPLAVPGHLRTNATDRYGRVLAFVFRGGRSGPAETRGQSSMSDIEGSVNLHLLRTGLAYPAFYRGLPEALREVMQVHARRARAAGRGVWRRDVTNGGIEVRSVEALSRDGYVWPKLYRRLVDHLATGGEAANFLNFVRGHDTRIFVPSEDRKVNFSDLIEVKGNRVRLVRAPEDLVVWE